MAARAHDVYNSLVALTEVAGALDGCRVANQLSAMASNMSKPYQAHAVLQHGFATPETLISDDPDEIIDFASSHDGVIYKSTSGIRSVVTRFDPVADRNRVAAEVDNGRGARLAGLDNAKPSGRVFTARYAFHDERPPNEKSLAVFKTLFQAGGDCDAVARVIQHPLFSEREHDRGIRRTG